jgi:trehalose 6-phosphate synthase
VDRDGKVLVPPESPSYTLKRVWLTKEEVDRYYYGFSNEALWPLCHLTHHRPLFEETDWRTYEAVNEKFARAVLAECGAERPFVLVQDYHFTCLPRQIRRERPDAVVGLFWHIPWPTPEAFQICPWKSEILEGMLGADFVGFHLPSYVHNFLNTVNAVLPVRIDWDRSAVLHPNGTTFVKPFPISIQPWAERSDSLPKDFGAKAREIRHELDLGDATVVVSVDRLDYTKGIPERLEAISLFFERNPQFVGKAVFVQLGAPSRVHIPKYRDLVTEIERKTDEVNWKWGTEHWKPVLLLKAHHDPATVYTFLRMADACIVSSLADGMNLVAKEYVASREEGGGALILSEFAGTAREFADALLVNPYDRSQFAEAIRMALEMPPEEQMRRMLRLRSQVAEKNVYRWAADLLTEMSRCAELTDYPNDRGSINSQSNS